MKQKSSKGIAWIRRFLVCSIAFLLTWLCSADTEAAVSSFRAQAASVKNVIARSASVDLTWNMDRDANAYEIVRAEGATGSYQQIAFLVGADVTNYTDTNVQKGHIYQYRIRTYRIVSWTDVYGEYTSPVSVSVPAALVQPKLSYKRAKNRLTITFKTAEGTEYETQYRFAGQKKWKSLASISGKLTGTIKAKVNSQAKFTIRIRTRMKVNGKTVYSKWAKSYTVK
ncbi:MAG: hypothetical protein K2J67_01175 [Lachnospiraceae bacterium]|nr:hypothetical protein [Lachnospiraceae bacterium]